MTRTIQVSTLLINTTAGSNTQSNLRAYTYSTETPSAHPALTSGLLIQPVSPTSPLTSTEGLAPLVVVKWTLKTKQEEKLLREVEDVVHSPREHQLNEKLPFNPWGQRKGWQEGAVRATAHLSRGSLPCTKFQHTLPKCKPLEMRKVKHYRKYILQPQGRQLH